MTAGAAIERAGGVDGEAVRQLTIMRVAGVKSQSSPDATAISRQAAVAETVLLPGDMLSVAAYNSSLITPNARRVIEWMSADDFDNVILAYKGPSAFGTKVRGQWQGLQKQTGTYERVLTVRTELRGTDYVAIVRCQFSRSAGDVQIVFNSAGGILDVAMMQVAP